MINQFIEFSNQTYNREYRCINCPNDCPETGNCEQCLERVHYGTERRTYNCNNILNFYIGKYTYKYASEIGHVFNHPLFENFERYNVLSLGCGPCTDIFGILNSINTNNRNLRLNYLGIDINRAWIPIHSWIHQRIGDNYAMQYRDVFDFVANPSQYMGNYAPNIIIINYLISDLLKADLDVNTLITQFELNIFRDLPRNSYLILNDYNRGLNQNDPRTYYSHFENSIRENSEVECFHMHFRHNINSFYEYGSQHGSNSILFPVRQEYRIFNPWEFCSSAQLIIRKN